LGGGVINEPVVVVVVVVEFLERFIRLLPFTKRGRLIHSSTSAFDWIATIIFVIATVWRERFTHSTSDALIDWIAIIVSVIASVIFVITVMIICCYLCL
jgi:hypothetical protein